MSLRISTKLRINIQSLKESVRNLEAMAEHISRAEEHDPDLVEGHTEEAAWYVEDCHDCLDSIERSLQKAV